MGAGRGRLWQGDACSAQAIARDAPLHSHACSTMLHVVVSVELGAGAFGIEMTAQEPYLARE